MSLHGELNEEKRSGIQVSHLQKNEDLKPFVTECHNKKRSTSPDQLSVGSLRREDAPCAHEGLKDEVCEISVSDVPFADGNEDDADNVSGDRFILHEGRMRRVLIGVVSDSSDDEVSVKTE